MRRLTLAAIGLAVLVVIGSVIILAFSRIADFELSQGERQTVSFSQGGNALEGTLITASEDGPVVLLVHGDGPQDRWSGSGYLPLVNTLLDEGISVFSWDKPGVGASTGNWLHQSMQDRADETVAALKALRRMPGYEHRRIGLLGFSQAGWVLPRVPARTDDAAFLVLMGGAIDWQDQGRYYATMRLTREGRTPEEIAAEISRQAAASRAWFESDATYQEYFSAERAAGRSAEQVLSEDRFGFARLNHNEDARSDIAGLPLPVLVLSGAEDLNADPQETVSTYRSIREGGHPLSRFRVVPDATHSLFSARWYNYQRPDQWPLTAQARFVLSGRNAYQGDVLETVTDWIVAASQDMP
ncbi:alpha/beta hydrolase [Pacificimonas sp. WHA3]|uniref:Alpha/beta hydrolase n=1 Tax=Pacificimonas pallii TaxID=2827236 RepID=A0ABS6SDI2_9SPHN|nr:alpha/beta hydrolase [Pacificimonas pallii]MBV7256477.1 alpha/beta hydrolase [Pacificimonas pallii]